MTGASPKALTAAGVGIVPEDRHAVGCITGMSLAENLIAEPARSLPAASACSTAPRCAARRRS